VALGNVRRDWPEMAAAESVDDWLSRLEEFDAVILATRWPVYEALREAGAAGRLAGRVVVDARRMFSAADFPQAAYLAIGNNPVRSPS
jgi:hypothetical protein